MPYPDDSLFPSADLWPEVGPGEGLQVAVYTDDPCPRVAITLDGLDPSGPSRVTVWRSSEGGKRRQVRGWSNRLVFGSDFGIDYEVPLGRPVRYDVQAVFDAYDYAYRQSLAVTAGASYLDDQQDPTLGA